MNEGTTTMLNQPTLEKLHGLRLSVMAGTWQEQAKDPKRGSLGFDERFALLVEAEHMARDNRRLSRLLKTAELRYPHACIEDVDTSRGVDKAMLMQLAGCGWVGEHLNALITGATGTGKSYLGCALGQMACRRSLMVIYRRVPRLFEELGLARVDGSYARVLAKLAKADVLILDDLGVGTLKEAQKHDLLEVLEDRYGKVSTVVTSQMDHTRWHEWIADPTMADAILDRLVHNAYKLKLTGPSRRKETATQT
jgi:DNA replication protein DnaC